MKPDIIIIGAGATGALMAERFAKDNITAVFIDEAKHLRGYDEPLTVQFKAPICAPYIHMPFKPNNRAERRALNRKKY